MNMSSAGHTKFPERLRAARELRQLSQSELAERAGLQPSAISHFEGGRRAPSFDNIKRLADALTVTTDYLLGRVEEMSSAAPAADRLFRKVETLSAQQLDLLENFADTLRQMNTKEKGKQP